MTGGRLYHHSAWAGWTLAPGAQNSIGWPGLARILQILMENGSWYAVCRPVQHGLHGLVCNKRSNISDECRSQINISHSPAFHLRYYPTSQWIVFSLSLILMVKGPRTAPRHSWLSFVGCLSLSINGLGKGEQNFSHENISTIQIGYSLKGMGCREYTTHTIHDPLECFLKIASATSKVLKKLSVLEDWEDC